MTNTLESDRYESPHPKQKFSEIVEILDISVDVPDPANLDSAVLRSKVRRAGNELGTAALHPVAIEIWTGDDLIFAERCAEAGPDGIWQHPV